MIPYYPDNPFLFPGDTKYGCMSIKAVEDLHARECRKLKIEISPNFRKGPHAFRRTRITAAIDYSNGDAVLVAEMFGNSPETIQKYYFTGIDLKKQRDTLNKREKI